MKSANELAKSCLLGAVVSVESGNALDVVASSIARDRLIALLIKAGITTCVEQAADAILADGFKRGV